MTNQRQKLFRRVKRAQQYFELAELKSFYEVRGSQRGNTESKASHG